MQEYNNVIIVILVQFKLIESLTVASPSKVAISPELSLQKPSAS